MTMPKPKCASYRPMSPKAEAEKILRLHFASEDGKCAFCTAYALIDVMAGECPPAKYARRVLAMIAEAEQRE